MKHSVCSLVLALGIASANAAPFTVTNLNDAGSGSLRDAISQANATPEADTITFGVNGTIVLTSGQLFITGPVTITGPGPALLTIDGNANNRIFLIQDASAPACPALTGPVDYHVTMSGMTLRNAHRNTDNSGGAMAVFHSLTLDNMVIRDNEAKAGAGVSVLLQYPNQSLTVTNSTFTNNIAKPKSSPVTGSHSGPALRIAENCNDQNLTAATVLIANSVFTSNRAQPATGGNTGRGGAFTTFSNADITIRDSRFVGNGIDIPNPFTSSYLGGAIYGRARSLTIERTEVSENHADFGGAMGFFSDIESQQTPQQAMQVQIVNSTISNNTAFSAQAITVHGNVSVSISNSTVATNTANGARTTGIGFNTGPTVPASAQNALAGTLTLASSILWNPGQGSPEIAKNVAAIPGPMVVNATNSIVGSLCGVVFCGPITLTGAGNQIGVDPILMPLAFNGGPTRTREPWFPGPAVDTGANPLALPTDQRGAGFPRFSGVAVDMGAYERAVTPFCGGVAGAPGSGFQDIPGSDPFCGNVLWIRNRGVTQGCFDSGHYCPFFDVSRLQMAAFMKRLGVNALSVAVLQRQDHSGALDPDADPIVCQTNDITLAFGERVIVDGVFSAFAMTDVFIVAVSAVSLDGGATWEDLPEFTASRRHARANRWTSFRDFGRGQLGAGQPIGGTVVGRFGLHVARRGTPGAGTLADSYCNLRVRIDRGDGASAQD